MYRDNPSGASTWVQSRLTALGQSTDRLQQRLAHPPAARPGRVLVRESDGASMPWRGHYTGEYLVMDYSGPTNIQRYREVIVAPDTLAFILRPWTALLNPPEEHPSARHSCASALAIASSALGCSVSLSLPRRSRSRLPVQIE
jgi:hypothetical protein